MGEAKLSLPPTSSSQLHYGTQDGTVRGQVASPMHTVVHISETLMASRHAIRCTVMTGRRSPSHRHYCHELYTVIIVLRKCSYLRVNGKVMCHIHC